MVKHAGVNLFRIAPGLPAKFLKLSGPSYLAYSLDLPKVTADNA